MRERERGRERKESLLCGSKAAMRVDEERERGREPFLREGERGERARDIPERGREGREGERHS